MLTISSLQVSSLAIDLICFHYRPQINHTGNVEKPSVLKKSKKLFHIRTCDFCHFAFPACFTKVNDSWEWNIPHVCQVSSSDLFVIHHFYDFVQTV